MHTLYFLAGLSLGSACGFLLALLLLHSRAQSLAEEMAPAQDEEFVHEDEDVRARGRAAVREWMYAHPSASASGIAK